MAAFATALRGQPRHDPGRNLTATPSVAAGPQVQAVTTDPAVGVPEGVDGDRTIHLSSIAASLKPVAWTSIWPDAVVRRVFTCLEGLVASQPQEPGPGKVLAFWKTSLIVDRQADAASSTSDIRARLV